MEIDSRCVDVALINLHSVQIATEVVVVSCVVLVRAADVKLTSLTSDNACVSLLEDSEVEL